MAVSKAGYTKGIYHAVTRIYKQSKVSTPTEFNARIFLISTVALFMASIIGGHFNISERMDSKITPNQESIQQVQPGKIPSKLHHQALRLMRLPKTQKIYANTANELVAMHPELRKDGPLAKTVLTLTDTYRNGGMKAAAALSKAVGDLYPVPNQTRFCAGYERAQEQTLLTSFPSSFPMCFQLSFREIGRL